MVFLKTKYELSFGITVLGQYAHYVVKHFEVAFFLLQQEQESFISYICFVPILEVLIPQQLGVVH